MEMQDKLKMYLAGLVVVAGVTGFYMIPDTQGFLRILAVVAALVVAAGVVWWSRPGREFVAYAHDSVAEGRKVVWPTRKEAIQVTGLVFLFVTVLALFMWAVDSGLSWLFYDVILGRGS
jgi:preprotein translocase subunit SecE